MQSICILRLSAIGDVCHATAAVQAIQKHNPDIKITWIIGKLEQALLDGLPDIQFIVFDKSKGKQAFHQLKQDLNGQSFDVLLHMQVAFRANWASRLIKAKHKIGFDSHRAKELHSLFINERIKSQKAPHVIEGFYAFAEQLGVPETELNDLHWNIPVSEIDYEFADEHLPANSRILVIAAASSKAERNWLPERYAQLADYASAKGFRVILCGGPAKLDRELADQITQYTETPITDLVGKTTLKQLLACLKNASLVLAPDTGPAHMAVTQGTPVIGLYAHSNPQRTGPYLYLDYVVEVYHQNLIMQKGKSASALRWGTRVKGADLMNQITVEDVQQQFDRVVHDFAL